jgi:hypothetical protein
VKEGDCLLPALASSRVSSFILNAYYSAAASYAVNESPVKKLLGFRSLLVRMDGTLSPGELRHVKFVLTQKELAFWNSDLDHTVVPGELTVWIAPNFWEGAPVQVRIEPTTR